MDRCEPSRMGLGTIEQTLVGGGPGWTWLNGAARPVHVDAPERGGATRRRIRADHVGALLQRVHRIGSEAYSRPSRSGRSTVILKWSQANDTRTLGGASLPIAGIINPLKRHLSTC